MKFKFYSGWNDDCRAYLLSEGYKDYSVRNIYKIMQNKRHKHFKELTEFLTQQIKLRENGAKKLNQASNQLTNMPSPVPTSAANRQSEANSF